MPKPAKIFCAGRAADLTGIDYKTLDYWARTEFLAPSLAMASGSGTRRLYSFNDLVALEVARRLRHAGISLQSLRRVIEHLQRRSEGRSLADTYLVSDGHDVYERHGPEELISLLRKPGQGVFTWIDVGGVQKDLRERLAA